MGEIVKMSFEGQNLANGLMFYDLKKKLIPGVALTWPWGYIHVDYHSSQRKFIGIYLRFQVSVYRTIGPLVYWLRHFFHVWII